MTYRMFSSMLVELLLRFARERTFGARIRSFSTVVHLKPHESHEATHGTYQSLLPDAALIAISCEKPFGKLNIARDIPRYESSNEVAKFATL